MTWQYEPARDLDKSLADRLRGFPREPDLTIFGLRSFVALLLRAWLKIYHRLEIRGRENLPVQDSYVVVANHSSHLDTLCLLSAMPLRKLHRVFPAAAQDYFFVSVPRLAIAAVVVNALPFGRQKHIRNSLELCRQLLTNPGNVLILFPEGTRTTNGQMGEFKPGIGSLIAGTNLSVLPCHLTGGFNAWPRSKWFPRPRKLTLRIGHPRHYSGVGQGREAAEQICLDLQKAVADLGQIQTTKGKEL